jgi:hypothetical protein
MGMLPITIRKRTITDADIVQIQATVDALWNQGRKHISKVLCRQWNWFQPLLTLNRKGLITLPPRLTSANNEKRNRTIPAVNIDRSPFQKKLANLGFVDLKSVRNTKLEPLYNSLIQQHHYLGYRQIVGNHLKYIAFIDDRPVACLGWGSAAWKVKSRDTFIGWDPKTRKENLHFIANNTRFLILSWVSVKYLASKILALNARRISDDWLNTYNYPLYLLETFIERDRFKGTCYKAANWILTGQTKGTAKKGHMHVTHGNIKDVYLYPLRKDFRKKLIG